MSKLLLLATCCFSCIILCVSGMDTTIDAGFINDIQLTSASCQDHHGAVTGLSTAIECNHGRQQGAPFWFLNGTVYELFSIPQYFPSIPVVTSYTSLNIPNVTWRLNDMVFRCATFRNNGKLRYGSCIQLSVTNSSYPGNVNQGPINIISIDYQRLIVQENSTTFGWTLRNRVNCSRPIELQGHVIMNHVATISPANVIRVDNEMNFGEILIPELSTPGDPLYYRLAAFDDNGTICSDVTSQNTYYRFDSTPPWISLLSPNSSSTCFNITTEMDDCASLYFVWPQREKGYSCLCPVYNSHDGRLVFNACVQGCESDFAPKLTEVGQVCLTGLNYSVNGTLFHFMCSTNPCTDNCFIKNILSSHMVIFSGQQGAVTGFSTSIPCDYGRQEEAPFWFINNTVYELFSIPQYFPSIPVVTSYTLLNIPNVTRRVHNTVFRCATFDRNGDLTSPDNAIRLIVSNGLNPGSISQPSNKLTIDYQQLHMQESGTLLGWIYSNANCFGSIEIQGHTIMNHQVVISQSNITRVDNSVIHSTQLLISDQLYYRLVALDDNGTICSDATSQKTYYRFEGSCQITMFSPVTLATCFNTIAEIGACPTSLYFIWPQRLEGLSCLCPVYDSDDGQSVFESCTQGCESDFMPHLAEDGQVCLTGLSELMNGTLFHFMCSTDLCTDNCFIKTIISSHMLIFSEYILVIDNDDEVAEIDCDLQVGNNLPFWFLNDTLYTSASLQKEFLSFYSNSTLIIQDIAPELNNTVFKCGVFKESELIDGSLTRLEILEPIISSRVGNVISFNYQKLEITSAEIRIGWTARDICYPLYELQQTINGSIRKIQQTNTTGATVSRDQFINSIPFRIVAVNSTGTICSRISSQKRHYLFSVTQFESKCMEPNDTVCLPIPDPQQCSHDDVEVVWLKACTVPLRAIIDDNITVSCVNDDDKPQYNEQNMTICFSTSKLQYFIHFQCAQVCQNHCTAPSSQLYEIISSFKMVMPERPTITYYNDSCFAINSSTEVSIQYIISSIGKPEKSSTGLQSPVCIHDPFPDECLEYNVTIIATNTIGTDQTTQNFTSNGCQDNSTNILVIVLPIVLSILLLLPLIIIVVLVVWKKGGRMNSYNVSSKKKSISPSNNMTKLKDHDSMNRSSDGNRDNDDHESEDI